jgi:hypothetical protein
MSTLDSLNEIQFISSIDDYLGPGETRFFSRGYQRAAYRVKGLAADAADAPQTGVRGTVDVSYPADWSKKKQGTDLRPHLSTIDALVLGVQLAELHLAHAYGLGPDDLSVARLRKVVLRAGSEPQEDLIGIPLSACLKSPADQPDADGLYRSQYECRVGMLRVRCEIDHPIVRRAYRDAEFESFDAVLGPGSSRFYGDGFRLRRHSIQDIALDLDELVAEAAVRFTTVPGSPVPTEGIGGARQPAVTLVDCFVVNLQLAQVLMYELDGLSRANSNTLWMMQTAMTAPAEPDLLVLDDEDALLRTRTAITAKHLLNVRGGIWRNVDLRASLAGIDMRCSFAHELPPEIAATAV